LLWCVVLLMRVCGKELRVTFLLQESKVAFVFGAIFFDH